MLLHNDLNTPSRRSARIVLLGLYCAAAGWIFFQGTNAIGNPGYFISVTILWAAMVLLWHWWPAEKSLIPVVAAAVIGRIAFMRFPASDDIYRYIWEGIIQLHGYNPYVLPPDSPALVHLHTPFWHLINHRDLATIYWPCAQLLFRIGASIHASPLFFKAMFLLFDAATAAILFGLLLLLGGEKRHVILYALNPLVLVSVAGEGHLEPVAIVFLCAALWCFLKQRAFCSWILLGFAITVKPTLAVFAPVFITKSSLKHGYGLAVVAALFIPYWSPQLNPFSVLVQFGTRFHYNGLAFESLAMLFGPDKVFPWVVAAAVIAYGAALLTTSGPLALARATAAILLIFSPTVHHWYYLLMLVFVAIRPSPAWTLLSLTTLFTAFRFNPLVLNQFWHNPNVLLAIEYVPFVLAIVATVFRGIRRGSESLPPVSTITIVIPTLNEEPVIGACVASVVNQAGVCQILVADGGSTDTTREISLAAGDVTVVDSPRGRGCQISAALRLAKGDIVCIIHADSRLVDGSCERIIATCNRNRSLVGGAMAARYKNREIRFRFTEFLNNCRARFAGISFGDQAQFFRRNEIGPVFPDQMLMEDIELSLRMKERGGTVFLKTGVLSSTRMWNRQGYFHNFTKVIFLSGTYLLQRRLGLKRDNAEGFYRAYYG